MRRALETCARRTVTSLHSIPNKQIISCMKNSLSLLSNSKNNRQMSHNSQLMLKNDVSNVTRSTLQPYFDLKLLMGAYRIGLLNDFTIIFCINDLCTRNTTLLDPYFVYKHIFTKSRSRRLFNNIANVSHIPMNISIYLKLNPRFKGLWLWLTFVVVATYILYGLAYISSLEFTMVYYGMKVSREDEVSWTIYSGDSHGMRTQVASSYS